MKKNITLVLVIAILALSLTACYINKQVETSEVGIVMNNGVAVDEVVGAGRYSKINWFAELQVIDVSAKTSTWSDPDLVTQDKQPIGLSIVIQYQRMRDANSVENMWSNYRSEALNDAALETQVLSRLPGIAKNVTTQFTLNEMLGVAEAVVDGDMTVEDAAGRAELTNRIFALLETELEEIYVDLLNVEITNIAPDPEYLALLSEKAQAQVEKEVAAERTALLVEQLKQEEAQTDIALEIASRENEVNQVLAEAYEESPELLQLRLMELMAEMYDEGDLIVFVPEGSPLSIVTGADGVIPNPNVPTE